MPRPSRGFVTPRGAAARAAFAVVLPVASSAALLVPATAQALTCGSNTGYTCTGTASQYAGGFNPGVGSGGSGGGACTATRTPVVVVQGNGDSGQRRL